MQRICEVCNKELSILPPKNRRFHSWCRRKQHRKKVINNRDVSGGRDVFRESIRKRDNYTCQECKEVWKLGIRRFDIHHLDNNKEGGKSTMSWDRKHTDRLITYCHSCHLTISTSKKKILEKAKVVIKPTP